MKAVCGAFCEPFADLSICNLTEKTVFLLALASAKRVSWLQALFAENGFVGEDVVLSCLPSFVAKTESDSYPIL